MKDRDFVVGRKYRYTSDRMKGAASYLGQTATFIGFTSYDQPIFKFPDGEERVFDKNNFTEIQDEFNTLDEQIKWHRQMAGALQQLKHLMENLPK